MKVDSITGIVTAAYPWKKCVRRMVDNRQQAQRVQENMERHMIDVGTHHDYIAEMQKSLAGGKVRRCRVKRCKIGTALYIILHNLP